jgi:septum site-determining protein MinC
LQDKKQLITIKGTRDGLTIFVDDDASFSEVITDLKDKLQSNQNDKNDPVVSVNVQSGNRYLDKEKQEILRKMIEEGHHFKVEAIEANVIHLDDALQWKEENEVKIERKVVRSGQVLEVTGDLLLIGDVNPGAKVMATGNIYILGNLYGVAHSGYSGDRTTFIAASYMKPTQLRIADYISRAPDYESEGVYMECGIIDEEQDKIIIDRLQLLSQKRSKVSGFERRMNNG